MPDRDQLSEHLKSTDTANRQKLAGSVGKPGSVATEGPKSEPSRRSYDMGSTDITANPRAKAGKMGNSRDDSGRLVIQETKIVASAPDAKREKMREALRKRKMRK